MIIPVQPFVGAIYSSSVPFETVEQILAVSFGSPAMSSDECPFMETGYYAAEMGTRLKRRFFAFGGLMDPTALLGIKQLCRGIEERHATGGRRTINLDPGYLDLYKVVLLSEKYSGRKIYVGEGVYADLTMLYEDGQFVPQPRAFPDFRHGRHQTFFRALREQYKQDLKTTRQAEPEAGST